jgi:putative radical SAM enzyme (TIGR03279 family)
MTKKLQEHTIKEVLTDSIAEELEIEAGDVLVSINEQPIKDVFDYRYLSEEEEITLLIRKPDGEEWELEIEKDAYEDLGLVFEDGLMDEYRSCRNKCIFCFIDQMPPGMRDTLYFKDDDARLSFLQGNYITLTNLSEEDMERILFYKLSPINVSVHTTNPSLRCKMLNNRFAGEALDKIKRFCDAGLEMNGQIVLCKGYNDGEELERTIHDLTAYLPNMQSVSVVPMGMTKYREGLVQVEPFTKEDALEVIGIINKWQHIIQEHYGIRMIHASDEWYLMAGLPLPSEEEYEGYPQLENGVGMIRLMNTEVDEYLAECKGDDRVRKLTLVTGELAASTIKEQVEKIKRLYPNVDAKVVAIRNDFFGNSITVAGLVTAQDIIAQLKGSELGDVLLVPEVMLRSGEEVFLDDLTISDVEKALQTVIRIVKSDGEAFVKAVIM